MDSALTSFVATIDTPEFRRRNMAKVRTRAAATVPYAKCYALDVDRPNELVTAGSLATCNLKLAFSCK